MNPLLTIARFEYSYNLRQPTFYLFVALVLGQGIWSGYQQEVLFPVANPAAGTYHVLSSFGAVVAFITVLLAGQSLTKDNEFNTTSLLYTLPITSRMHFAGRFSGTYATALTLAAFYPIGALLYSIVYTPAVTTISGEALIDGFIRLVALNCFIIVSITLSLTVFFRSVWGAYVVLFLVVLYFILAESDRTTQFNADIWLLLDPFGVDMVRDSIDSMTIDTDLLTFSDLLFINRLLWIGLALGMLAQAEAHFSFDTFRNDQAARALTTDKPAAPVVNAYTVPAVPLRFDWRARWRTTLHLARLEFVNLVRQPSFQITTGLLVVLAVLLATVFTVNPDFPELPITSRMTALRLPMGLFIGLFLVLMTGELIFTERTTGFWPIYDALPQPDSVLFVSKLLVLAGSAIILTFVLFLTGIGIQLGQGFYRIDWGQYASDLLLDGFIRYCQLIALASLVAVLTNNRVICHLVNVFIFLTLTLIYQFGAHADFTFLYSFLPGSSRYSELIGYGANTPIRLTLHVIWWGVAGLLVIGSVLGWNRGLPGSLPLRFRQWSSRFSWRYGLVSLSLVLFVLFFSLQLQTRRQQAAMAQTVIHYNRQTVLVKSISGGIIRVQITYHHPYQVRQLRNAVLSAIHEGERLFGHYPYPSLEILEVPTGSAPIWSKPGQFAISEKQGWTADYRQPEKLDHIDYLVSREVFRQWLVHRLQPSHQPGGGFVRQSLADYLALDVISRQYGTDRLKQRLLQRKALYVRSRNRIHKPEVPVLKSTGNDALEYGRAALALNSIGQVWGSKPLSLTIAQFYKQAVQKPGSATASAFANILTNNLPDSLRFLTTYLSGPLWFDFKVGRIATLPDRMTVDVFATKWCENTDGKRHYIPINDFVPLVVVDEQGREIYRQLAHPNPSKAEVTLPVLPTARAVLIDPLGAWPELSRHDNNKLLKAATSL